MLFRRFEYVQLYMLLLRGFTFLFVPYYFFVPHKQHISNIQKTKENSV